MHDLADAIWLRAQFDAGRSVTDVAQQIHRTPRAVRYAAHRHGIELPQRRQQRARRSVLEDIDQLATLRAAGVSVSGIAKMTRSTHAEVRTVLDTHGITGPVRPSLVDPQHVRELAGDGMSFRAIAKQLNVAPSTVRIVAHEHKIVSPHQQHHRPSELRNKTWLRHEYIKRRRTMVDIGRQLGVLPATVGAALDRLGINRRYWPQLHDRAWLQAEYVDAGRSLPEIAAQLGASPSAVRAAIGRAEIPPRSRAHVKRPPPRELLGRLDEHVTLAAVARSYSVAPATVKVWFAEIGVFKSKQPAIPKRALQRALNSTPSEAAAVRALGVQPITVRIERLRHRI